MVSVLYKELEYTVEKLQVQEVGGRAAKDKKKITTWIHLVNKTSQISPHKVL